LYKVWGVELSSFEVVETKISIARALLITLWRKHIFVVKNTEIKTNETYFRINSGSNRCEMIGYGINNPQSNFKNTKNGVKKRLGGSLFENKNIVEVESVGLFETWACIENIPSGVSTFDLFFYHN
jgi:hypothetical protein